MARVRVPWDNDFMWFDMDRLETAWLMLQECELPTQCARRLHREFNFDYGDAIHYTVAVRNHWSPEK